MAEVDTDIEIEQPKDDEKKRKGGASKPSVKRIRLALNEAETGPLTTLSEALKERGLKNYDLSDTVSEALATIPESFWKEKLEELTPLEWKIQAALDNPEMREKLVSLLEGKTLSVIEYTSIPLAHPAAFCC